MITYHAVEEEGTIDGLETYRTFGIVALNERGKELFHVSDVSTNGDWVKKLAVDCTDGELVPEQLYDVIRDRLD